MGVKINRMILNGNDKNLSLAVFMFNGNSDPDHALDSAIGVYSAEKEFYEFIDARMDNPWIRVVLEDFEPFNKHQMNVEGRFFDVYQLHKSNTVEIVYISFSQGTDTRPQPIVDCAVQEFANGRVYNAFIDSDLRDLWSRLIIIGINNIGQDDFNIQRI